MRASFFSVTALLALGCVPVRAGSDLSSITAGQTAKEIEDLGEIESVDDSDLGGKAKFRASIQPRAEFNTNAKLSGDHSSGDLIFFPQVEVGFNTPLPHNFSFDIAAKLESGIYADNDERSFIGYSIISTLDWRPKFNWPRFYVGAEPYRYDSFDTGDKITQALGLTTGTDWGLAFNKGYSLAFVGYSFTEYLADPTIDNRSAHKAIIGVTHQLNSRLFSTVFYQFAFSDYENIDREDLRHLVGGNLTYQMSRNLYGSLIASFVDSDSTQDFASYQSFGISASLTLQY